MRRELELQQQILLGSQHARVHAHTHARTHTHTHTERERERERERLTTAVSSYISRFTDANTICAVSINTLRVTESHCGRRGGGGSGLYDASLQELRVQ